ncbi:MAG: DUF4838 domain-containing protein [Candidatus Hydrogenedentes bacterium]|nr:DUF4838 domain-containing protein [Candidatus Hydrogenedentota bacterium]
MKGQVLIRSAACLFVALQAHAGLTIARDAKASVSIVVSPTQTSAEQTAANELAAYLSRVTGVPLSVLPESDANAADSQIYVGATAFAKQQGIDSDALGPEEWIIRSVGEDLILTGGHPRGAMYAVYRFLEDDIGVHWWNAYEETVPQSTTLAIPDLDRRGKPTIRYRDIYMLYSNDGGRFAARNRLNRAGDAPIAGEFGGEMGYGPPYHVHTFNMYIPPETYFADHPEWFSLIDGKRDSGQAQLCLTNPELRQVFLEKLKNYIATSHADALENGAPPPLVFSVSQNDWAGMCQCDACQAITKAEESEVGPLIDFINFLADSIKEEHPEVFIDTLAYMMTQKAPKSIRPRDNVIIRLCDTQSNFTQPITAEENAAFREQLEMWAQYSKNLRIWDYAVTYAPYYGLPLPTVHTYPADFQFYAEHNVEGVFTELEYSILADMRDFKVWMMMKLLEDPYRDYAALVQQFTDGFYGSAGRYVRDYLAKLETASDAKVSYLSMGASPRQHRYLDLDFMIEAQQLFDEAERAVDGDPVLLRRVRHARLPLDRASVVLHPDLIAQWTRTGHEPEAMPLDRDAIAARYKDTWYTQIDFRIPESGRAPERAEADAEVKQLTTRPAFIPLPERFRGLPAGTVFDYPADLSRNWQDVAKRVADTEAESKLTNRLELSDEDMKKYALPMPWGLYDTQTERGVGSAAIKPEDVPGTGYHWYKMGAFPVTPSCYVYFFWSWIIQFDVGSAVDPANHEQPFEVWARIKFEGPGFPHGKPDAVNAISVERVVLVKAGAP